MVPTLNSTNRLKCNLGDLYATCLEVISLDGHLYGSNTLCTWPNTQSLLLKGAVFQAIQVLKQQHLILMLLYTTTEQLWLGNELTSIKPAAMTWNTFVP